jgi:hypothetical protein
MAAIAEEAELALDGLLTRLREFGCDVLGAGLDHEGAYFTNEYHLCNPGDTEVWYFPAYIHLATREEPMQVMWGIIQKHPKTRLAVLQTKTIPMR